MLDVFIVVTSLWEVAVDIVSMVYQEQLLLMGLGFRVAPRLSPSPLP